MGTFGLKGESARIYNERPNTLEKLSQGITTNGQENCKIETESEFIEVEVEEEGSSGMHC
jgi:hypothetical protein